MKLRCLIVDDEPPAIRIIENYLSKLEDAELCATATNAIEAFNYLQKEKIDVLFLDVNMPEISGISFLKLLKATPTVILTTAYSEYALESYEYNVTDYLLKPIRFERFIAAFEKAKNEKRFSNQLTVGESPEFIELKMKGSVKKVFLKTFVTCKVWGTTLNFSPTTAYM